MAERGRETLRFGPMKPVGLSNPHKPGRAPLRGGAAPAGQCAGHAVEHGGLPDQAQARRAGPHLPHDPGPGRRPSSRGSAACTATPSSTAPSCSTASCACAPSRGSGSPGRSRAARATSRAPPSACSRAAPRPPSASAQPGCRRRRPRPSAPCSATSPAATSPPKAEGARARSFQPMNVNFGLFPPLDAPSHDAAGNRIKGKERGAAKKRAHVRPRAGRSRPLACGRSSRDRGTDRRSRPVSDPSA